MKSRNRGPFTVRTPGLIRWSRRFLFVAGIVALAYVGLTLLDAKLYQAFENRRFQEELENVRSSHGKLPIPLAEAAKPASAADLADGSSPPLGRIEVNSIGLSAMILEGIDARTLRRAVGHIPGTPLPGQPGNVAIAGHRDTFFRALRNIRKDDEITLETMRGLYRYRVDSIKVVDAGEMQVLDKSDDAILTLVTCYPFSFVGPAPKRFIVRAHELATTAAAPISAGAIVREPGRATTVAQGMR